MMIVGQVQTQEEAFDIQQVVKVAMVAQRFRFIGSQAGGN